MDPVEEFARRSREMIAASRLDPALGDHTRAWFTAATKYEYSYHFRWLGRPIIQYPQDILAIEEIIWSVRPDLIVETGIAHGGSLILSASMLAMLDYCDAVESGQALDPRRCRRRVLGVDIDIRPHNRSAIESHPMAHRIDMLTGSSVDPGIVAQVHESARAHERVLVILDSNHTHEHVLAELVAYAPLTSPGSYCVVLDTVIEDMPQAMEPTRPWGKGNNPKTAVHEYLRRLDDGSARDVCGAALRFEIDREIQDKLLITVAPDGYLRRV